jgi:hypothetical protein
VQCFPLLEFWENQTEVSGVNTFLGCWQRRCDMTDKLMAVESEDDGAIGHPTHFATQSDSIEFFGLGDVSNGESQMEDGAITQRFHWRIGHSFKKMVFLDLS